MAWVRDNNITADVLCVAKEFFESLESFCDKHSFNWEMKYNSPFDKIVIRVKGKPTFEFDNTTQARAFMEGFEHGRILLSQKDC